MYTKQKTFKRYLTFTALFIGLSAVTFFSCTKVDVETAEQKSFNESKFFSGSEANPALARIAAALKQQNKLTGFIKTLATKEGYALWNKAIIKQNNAGNNTKTNDAGDTIVLLPLVLENTSYVNGWIHATLNGNVALDLFRGNDYDKHPYANAATDSTSADRYALQLMYLNYKVFGDTVFKMKDHKLFTYNSIVEPDSYARFSKLRLTNNSASRGHFEQGTVTHCENHHNPECDQARGMTKGSPICDVWVCQESVTWYFVADDDNDSQSGGGGGSNGGGGGGAGGPIDPNAPNNPPPANPSNPTNPNAPANPQDCLSSSIENGQLPCGGNGDLPFEPVKPAKTPCEKTKALAQSSVYNNFFKEIQKTVDSSNEHAYTFDDVNGGYTPMPVLSPDTPCTVKITVGAPINGYTHSHTAGCFTMFSIGDLYSVYELSKAGKIKDSTFTLGLAVKNTNGYVFVIDDLAEFNNFCFQHFETDREYDNMERLYDSYDIDNDDNPSGDQNQIIARMLKLYKQEKSGIKMLERSADGKKYSLLSLDDNNNLIKTPC